MADQLNLRSTTFTAGNSWLASYGTSLRNNDLYLGRCRWTSGDPVLEQADCEAGALYAHATNRLVYYFRLDGTGTADNATRAALATPVRGSWHYNDNTGTPALDNRVVAGDSYLLDSGSGDRYVQYYDSVAGAFKGFGVLAEYRTAATSGSKSQHSERVIWRAASWNGSATKYREMRARTYVTSPADASDTYEWRLTRFPESGSERDVLRMRSNGALYVQGAGSGEAGTIVLSTDLDGSGGDAQFGAITCASGDIDQASCTFVHGNSSRRAMWRFKNPTDGYTGTAALAISVLPKEPATALLTTVNSPSYVWQGNYWSGAASVDSFFYSQYIVDATTPSGHLRFGASYDDGTFDLYSDGGVQFQMDPNGTSNLANTLTLYPTLSPTASLPSTDSPYFSAVARSDVGGSEANRYIFWNTKVDSVVTASDKWSFRLYSMGGGSPTEILGVRSTGEILPADGSSAVLELSAALGTHTGTTNSDKTANSKLGTLKVKLSDGTTAHIQLYAN